MPMMAIDRNQIRPLVQGKIAEPEDVAKVRNVYRRTGNDHQCRDQLGEELRTVADLVRIVRQTDANHDQHGDHQAGALIPEQAGKKHRQQHGQEDCQAANQHGRYLMPLAASRVIDQTNALSRTNQGHHEQRRGQKGKNNRPPLGNTGYTRSNHGHSMKMSFICGAFYHNMTMVSHETLKIMRNT